LKKGSLKRIKKIEVPVFFSDHRPARLWNLADRTPRPLSWLQGKKVLAFCGLAQPDSFAFSLRQLKSDIVRLTVFPDHHVYDQKGQGKTDHFSPLLKPDL
jgi:tetraacyldisaccharide 4'-kinase